MLVVVLGRFRKLRSRRITQPDTVLAIRQGRIINFKRASCRKAAQAFLKDKITDVLAICGFMLKHCFADDH